jgi:nucleotide-binding universal stress UspA family protein
VNAPIAVHPLGLLIAAVFAVSMSSLLWWMMHPPEPVGQAVAHALYSVSAVRRILVPVQGFAHNSRAVELACRLGAEQKAEIVLGSIIEVPMAIPLGTPLPAEEERARADVEMASDLVRLHDLVPIPVIERDRNAGRGILRIARDRDADLAVVGLDPHRVAAGGMIGRTIESLLRQAGIEVIIDFAPES